MQLMATLANRAPLCALLVVFVVFTRPIRAQTHLMMPDSNNSRIVLFNPVDGAVMNANYFPIAGGTPIHAMQVGNEIWVSEQLGDRVARYSLTGSSLGQIGGGTAGGLDNIRGMELIGGTVYVTNAGTANTAPGPAVVMYTTTGASLGYFSTTGLSPAPFGVLSHQGGLLISSSSGTDDVHRFSLAGASLGTFYNGTSLNFGEQLDVAANGDILVAGFSSNNVVRFDTNTGVVVSTFAASGARGVHQLGNGNILWTNSSGVHVYNVSAETNATVYSGGGRYLDFLTLGSIVVPGDFDGDGDVDGADFVAWQTHFPLAGGATLADGDADADGDVDGADFVVWQTNFPFPPVPGATPVPEPEALYLSLLAGLGVIVAAGRQRYCGKMDC